MIEQGSGAIVNVASGAAFRPIKGMSTYSASKAGVVGMSRVLALECARKGIRVNIVAPGHTLTEGNLQYLSREEIDAIGATLVPGRVMTPEEPGARSSGFVRMKRQASTARSSMSMVATTCPRADKPHQAAHGGVGRATSGQNPGGLKLGPELARREEQSGLDP